MHSWSPSIAQQPRGNMPAVGDMQLPIVVVIVVVIVIVSAKAGQKRSRLYSCGGVHRSAAAGCSPAAASLSLRVPERWPAAAVVEILYTGHQSTRAGIGQMSASGSSAHSTAVICP